MSSLTVYAPQITILDSAVKAINGLFCLNDLHKASGGEKKHQPFNFMRNNEVVELIDELVKSSDNNVSQVTQRVNGGEMRGTYACKELVYRYAMWISPKFALLVIRTFDAVVSGKIVVQPLNPDQTLPLRNAVNMLVTRAGIVYPEAYKMVHQKFAVNHIKELTVEQVSEAVTYIHWLTMTANTRNHANQANTENAHALAVHMSNCATWFDAVKDPLSQLNPQLISCISGQFYEGNSVAKLINRALRSM